jgi:dihydrolipoamide dehydrogenase
LKSGNSAARAFIKAASRRRRFLRSAEVYRTAKKADEFGVVISEVGLRFSQVQSRKQKIIDQLHNGVKHLMKKGKIDVYEGIGRILGRRFFPRCRGRFPLRWQTGMRMRCSYRKTSFIATGSRPRSLPGLELDGENVLSSDEALELEQLPASMLIVGGGVIGIEWASMLCDFGVDVTVIEYADRIFAD